MNSFPSRRGFTLVELLVVIAAWVFGSLHPGGAQFVLCDGATRFLPETMSYQTLLRLAYIHDKLPVTIPLLAPGRSGVMPEPPFADVRSRVS